MNLAISRLRWLSIPDAVQEMPMLQPIWNLACDMAVEGVINDLNLPMLTNAQAAGQVQVLQQIAPRVNNLLTAEKIYAYLRMNPPSATEFARLKRLFSPDNHALWYAPTARVAMAEEQATLDNGGGTSGTSQRDRPDDDRPNDGQQEDASTAQAQAALSALLQDWQHIAEQMQTDLWRRSTSSAATRQAA